MPTSNRSGWWATLMNITVVHDVFSEKYHFLRLFTAVSTTQWSGHDRCKHPLSANHLLGDRRGAVDTGSCPRHPLPVVQQDPRPPANTHPTWHALGTCLTKCLPFCKLVWGKTLWDSKQDGLPQRSERLLPMWNEQGLIPDKVNTKSLASLMLGDILPNTRSK